MAYRHSTQLIALGLFVVSLAPPLTAAETTPVFKDARLQVQQGEKQKEVDATLRYEAAALVVQPTDKKQIDATRTINYADVTSAEYTFGTSPRISAALLVSPLFLFSHSKSHWLNVKTATDYALLRLNKSNYKLVIAELEKRTHVTVASVGENK